MIKQCRDDTKYMRVRGYSCVIFILYICLMLWEIFIGPYRSYSETLRYNITPFNTIKNFLNFSSKYSFETLFINLAGNIVTFVPFGFLVPIIFRRANSFGRILVLSVISITLVELLQLVLRVGVFDIDDIIFNTLGCLLGYICYKTIFRLFEKNS